MKLEIEEKNLIKSIDILDNLSELLNERIQDLYKIKGTTQSRHAYKYYLEKVLDSLSELKNGVKIELYEAQND